MYISIPNVEDIKALKTTLENFSRRTGTTKLITTFLLLILRLNNFVFKCKNYLQIKGSLMRTIFSTAYANIFMDHFERMVPFLGGLSLGHLRFIDNMLFILPRSKDQLITFFLNDLNTKHNSIKFGYKILQSSIPFLTRKPISKNNYANCTQRFIGKKQTDKTFCILIQSTLYHWKSSISYSHVLGLKRTCLTTKKLYFSELKTKTHWESIHIWPSR